MQIVTPSKFPLSNILPYHKRKGDHNYRHVINHFPQENYCYIANLCREMFWRIEFFGNSRLLHETTTIERFRTQKGILLLAVLASFPRRTHSRETVCELLWPEEEPEKQRNRLRYELSILRKATWSGLFSTPDNTQIALAETVTSDVASFEQALRTANKAQSPQERVPYLEAAVALYKGDFLPGFYDDWVLTERDRLRELYGTALTQLFVNLDQLGLHDAAKQIRNDCAEKFPERKLPPLRSITDSASALQSIATDSARRFHGRETELGIVQNWLNSNRPLLTLTGMGGMGKTRLAKESVLAFTHTQKTNRIFFLSLADITEGEGLLEAIATVLPEEEAEAPTNADVQETIAFRLARYKLPVILVLDNFEQIQGGASTLETLLTSSPNVRCLITSQTALNIPQEQILPLNPLPTVNALALFLDRARSVRPDFAPTEEKTAVGTSRSGGIIAKICHLLEGIPLALELAAARVAGLGATEVLKQLSQRLDFLSSSQQSMREQRHESLRAALEWTIGLLPDSPRNCLGEASVFVGGFTLAALHAIHADSTEASLLSELEELRRFSLIRSHFQDEMGNGSETTRWSCLEIVREFAETILPLPQRQKCQERHAHYFARESNEIGKRSMTGEWRVSQIWLRNEHYNANRAIVFAATTGNTELLFQFSGSFARFLFESGYWSDCEYLLSQTENIIGSDTNILEQRSKILGLRGGMARRRGREADARQYWEQRLELFAGVEESNDALDTLLDLTGQSIDLKQWDHAENYLHRAESLQTDQDTAKVLQILHARIAAEQGNGTSALQYADAVYSDTQFANSYFKMSLYRDYYLAPIYRRFGKVGRAMDILKSALHFAHESGSTYAIARFCLELASLWEESEALEKAGIALYTAQQIHTELGARSIGKTARQWLRFRQKVSTIPDIVALLDSLTQMPWQTSLSLLLEEDL